MKENPSNLRNEVFLLIHTILTALIGGICIWLIAEVGELRHKVKTLEDHVTTLTVKDFIRNGGK